MIPACIILVLLCWWYVDEKFPAHHRLFLLADIGAISLLICLYFQLEEEWADTRMFCFVTAVTLAARRVYADMMRLLDRKQLERHTAYLDTLPIRPELCTAADYTCTLNAEALRELLQKHMEQKPGDTAQGSTAVYEAHNARFELWSTALNGGGWILALCDHDADTEFHEKELVHLLTLNGSPIDADAIPGDVTSLAICEAGELRIYPAATADTYKSWGLIS